MFIRERIRETKKGKVKYAYIVENQWNPLRKKYNQKIIYCLGRIDKLLRDGTGEKIITAIDNYYAKKGFSSLSNGIVIRDLKEEKILSKTFNYGEMLLAEAILDNLSLTSILKSIHENSRGKNSYISLSKFLTSTTALIAYQLHSQIDHSERAASFWYQTSVFLKDKITLTKDDFYRTLDVLISHKDEIEKQYYLKNQDLFNLELDLVLFDTTSIYYYDGEEKINEDSILQYGFSKDGKGNLKQVIVGVLMTDTGVPIAHEVFSGNKPDMKSFPEIIKKIKDKYNIKRVIFVADRGMVSEDNLTLIEEEEMEYILGVKMRKLTPVLKNSLLPVDPDNMEKIHDNLYVTDFPFYRLTEKEQNKIIDDLYNQLDTRLQTKDKKEEIRQRLALRRFIVCFNPFVAKDNQQKREYFKKIIANKIKFKTNKSWFVKNGYSKYIKVNKMDIVLNEEKLKQEELYDGVWILTTNCGETITSETISLAYKSLQFVERGFRDLKSLINVRPIFHFKEERIKAHIFLAFLTLIVKWYVLNTINASCHEDGLRFIESMLNLKAIEIDQSIPLYVRTAIDEGTIENMKKLKMKIPNKTLVDPRKKPIQPPMRPGRPKKINKSQLFLTLP